MTSLFTALLLTFNEHLTIVFQCLEDNQFYLKQSKCSFLQESIEYLGHIISYNGVAPNQ